MNNTALLICPVCREGLYRDERRLSCGRGHRFDAAKQGYFNLLTGRGTKFLEDTAEMVAAREDFQRAGHYEPLAQAVTDMMMDALQPQALEEGSQHIVDVGAGTGYYLGRVIDGLSSSAPKSTDEPEKPRPSAVALDISRYAMRRAAKIRGVTALVWDVWQPLPLADASADVILNIFAPRNGAEFRRITRPGGLAVVVTPLPEHLAEIRGELGLLGIAEDKEQAVAERLNNEGIVAFELVASQNVRSLLNLTADDAVNLALMGPAGHHHSREEFARRLGLTDRGSATLQATAAFRVQAFRRTAR